LREFSRKSRRSIPIAAAEALTEANQKLNVLLEDELRCNVAYKAMSDFLCGEGAEAVEIARPGANAVIGVDIRRLPSWARERAVAAGVQDRCLFTTSTAENHSRRAICWAVGSRLSLRAAFQSWFSQSLNKVSDHCHSSRGEESRH